MLASMPVHQETMRKGNGLSTRRRCAETKALLLGFSGMTPGVSCVQVKGGVAAAGLFTLRDSCPPAGDCL